MSRILAIALAMLTTTAALASGPSGVTHVQAVNRSIAACAARPLPSNPPRVVSPELAEAVKRRVATWHENRRTRFPGLSVAIRWDDGREITAVSGVADAASGRRVTAGTPFALASVSKPFTAALALLLDACGVMPLNTRVAQLVPYADVRPEATIEDLLRHEGGMSDWLTDKYSRMDWLIAHPNGKVGPRTAVRGLLPRGEIGDFEYSNSSFTLVTLASEVATGLNWQALMQELLLSPLQLNETQFGPVSGASRTHIWSSGRMRPFGQRGWGPTKSVAAVLRGAGDLFSTPRDLARFGELLYGDRLLQGAQTQRINGIANLTGLPWSYTIGTMMDRSWLGALRTYGHTGGYSGVSTTLRRVPELGVTLAVTANGMGTPGNYADELAIELIDLLDVPAPAPAQAVAGALGAGLHAAIRANPEPFPIAEGSNQTICGDPRSDPAGLRWVSISSGSWSGVLTGAEELPAGDLVVVGRGLMRAGDVRVRGSAIWRPAKGTWSPFGSFVRSDGSVADLTGIALDAVRKRLYVSGDFRAVISGGRRTAVSGVAQLNLQTGKWSPLGGGIRGGATRVRAIDVDEFSGALAVAGDFSRAGGVGSPRIAVWHPTDGWSAINGAIPTQVSGEVEAIAISESGAVSVSGYLSMGGVETLVARWNPDLRTWRTLATSSLLGDAPRTLAVERDGNLILGTGVSWYGSPLLRESALSGYGWERLGAGVSLPRKSTWISALAATQGGGVLVGGTFTESGGEAIEHIARWDPARRTLQPIGGGLPVQPDLLASSARVDAYAAMRVRGAPGSNGQLCLVALALPAPSAPSTPTVTPRRRSLLIQWDNASLSAVTGWIATVRGGTGGSRSCITTAAEEECLVEGLAPNTRYRVTLRAYRVPTGPGEASPSVSTTTRR